MKGVCQRVKRRFLLVPMAFILLAVFVVSAQASSTVRVVLDGVELEFAVAPIIKEGRVLVPIRDIAQGLGADVSWDGENKTVLINTGAGKMEFPQGFYRPDYGNLPVELRDWIGYSREVPTVQERHYDGHRYVLITEGMKPTGGYGVEVEEVLEEDGELKVLIRSYGPEEGQMVTQALTYPYDLIVVENEELPLCFTDTDAPNRYFMALSGLETIDRPIVASSEWIKIFGPLPGEVVGGAITLMGIANVFEGTVSYELLTKGDEVLERGFTTATMLDWGYFEEAIHLPESIEKGELILRLYSESAKDGSKMFVVEIPLLVK